MHRSDFSGVAYIEQVTGFIPRAFPIEGHWELPGLDHVAEDGPGWQTASEAVSWGRKRAPAVWLRVHRNIYSHRYAHADSILFCLQAPVRDDYVIYSAGEDPVSQEAEVRRWPGAAARREAEVLPDYGGDVYLVQWAPERDRAGFGFLARWERVRDGVQQVVEVAGPDWDEGTGSAVAWARERAPYVLVCEGPPDFGYQSAGEREPPGLDLPRWRGLAELQEHFRELPPPADPWTGWMTTAVGDESKSF